MIFRLDGIFTLTGKTALITGAGGLLGKEHAAALLEAGCSHEILTDVPKVCANIDNMARNLGTNYPDGKVHLHAMDVTIGRRMASG